ncbi:ribonuclease P protein component [uncultured Cohaesibacter sp.]|uniref:ribonuclease P protein component n=1 Tax=uncultured Cohaesibacter sp. TaxID=1002546 RepID=UPI0029C777FC|nr:ribonuclease P protein component [uncultured Cohaesibacter sp.]
MLRLKKRSEFLTAAKGGRLSRRGFVLQAYRRSPEDNAPPRVGFTVTKKVGNAVVRNRIKRRLRELARLHGPEHMQSGWDYVLIGRTGALHLPFDAMTADFRGSLRDAKAGKFLPDRKPGRDRRQTSRKSGT